MIKKLLSLPPNLVGAFHKVTGLSDKEYFCTNDPVGHRLGSGGGTTWLLEECHKASAPGIDFMEWLKEEPRILIHAGGQSRRLPSYAPSGKILTPIPIFRWERGQKLNQTLLDLQLPLYERIVDKMPPKMHTMVVSGDVYIRASDRIPPIPDVDVVCYGLWLDASVAKNHGVFYSLHESPSVLHSMLQKPSVDELNSLSQKGYYLTDIGIWLLSDRAVELLQKKSKGDDGKFQEYDLYSEFGLALGTNPRIQDPELAELSVAIIPLPDGEFYHFGTSREMISSTLTIQNLVNDQRRIMHRGRKPHPSIFVQNSVTRIPFSSANTNVWIENSYIGDKWSITSDNIVTGVPVNDWQISLSPGQCVDIIPINDDEYVVRTYRIDDRFAGEEQLRPRFPILKDIKEMGKVVSSMLDGSFVASDYRLLSAEKISELANLPRLTEQRRLFRKDNWVGLANNHQHSVFYQLDLCDAAKAFATDSIPIPPSLPDSESLMTRIHDAMFKAQVQRLSGKSPIPYETEAFSLLRDGLTRTVLDNKQLPRRAVCADQIVWSRSPVRIDIAGGWTDTPPFCLMEGGNVINLAIELNGQPPLQAYVRPCHEPHIICRSIDLGAAECIETFEQLLDFNKVGSPFSIPKAALALAGFHPRFCRVAYPSLKAQLEEFGGGLEITLFSAIPAGSGLGTSSILAATVLGAISDFCSLAWDKTEICKRTLVLEQLLTTGGGWQDQFGGVIGGVKLLQTLKGFDQSPNIRWLPDTLFTEPEYAQCHLLYYTGITRTAKDILAEIVRRMFLNHGEQIRMLRDMKIHTMETYDAIQRHEFERMGKLVRKTWSQNKALDHGTNPPEVEAITGMIDDLCLGYKLPGAGGGGYLYMIAKDPQAAARIRHTLQVSPPNPNARLVEMTLSKSGLHVTRS